MEIERKWLVDIHDIPYDLKTLDYLDIEQAYINFSPTIRIRKITNTNEYILTIKSSSIENGIAREEKEIYINEKQYNNLLLKKEGIVLNKTRYRVKEDKYTLEIDVFHKELEGFVYLEVEFESIEEAKKYVAPSWVKKELTDDHKYSNASLAKGSYKEF